MTELIVALDGPSNQYALACDLIEHAAVRWFKVGPQLMCSYDWQEFTHSARGFPDEIKIFLDLKLADTADTVSEAVRRAADAGISAVSVYTSSALLAAVAGARGTNLHIWKLITLTDDEEIELPLLQYRVQWANANGAKGIICPSYAVEAVCPGLYLADIIVPGVRLNKDDKNKHKSVMLASECEKQNISFAVVGRPICSADDPIAAAKLYKEALL